jgi:hypothetical protein
MERMILGKKGALSSDRLEKVKDCVKTYILKDKGIWGTNADCFDSLAQTRGL